MKTKGKTQAAMTDAKKSRALQACRLVIEAYRNWELSGGSIDWDDVDLAYAAVCDALR